MSTIVRRCAHFKPRIVYDCKSKEREMGSLSSVRHQLGVDNHFDESALVVTRRQAFRIRLQGSGPRSDSIKYCSNNAIVLVPQSLYQYLEHPSLWSLDVPSRPKHDPVDCQATNRLIRLHVRNWHTKRELPGKYRWNGAQLWRARHPHIKRRVARSVWIEAHIVMPANEPTCPQTARYERTIICLSRAGTLFVSPLGIRNCSARQSWSETRIEQAEIR